mgnify:CR=1 FL=1
MQLVSQKQLESLARGGQGAQQNMAAPQMPFAGNMMGQMPMGQGMPMMAGQMGAGGQMYMPMAGHDMNQFGPMVPPNF